MRLATKFYAKLRRSNSGQGLVEYGLILAAIAIVVITILESMGINIRDTFQTIANAL